MKHSKKDKKDDGEKKHRKKSKKHKKSKSKKGDIKKSGEDESFDVPLSLMTSQIVTPITKEEWEKKQSVTKRVFDETTGRYRLIKGDGEVIEEIVSKERHKEINRQATKGDGNYFQKEINK
ncbi:ADP-ribosylation factor-like protein 6-interacting protein 4 [Onthophagus taurus]|uniref:ADP-ribosylation factor-like protein 6-interacting protein 4 n=1 Tax=Onthophagus taurus TaxID=166361 RepID=UPI0039BDE670